MYSVDNKRLKIKVITDHNNDDFEREVNKCLVELHRYGYIIRNIHYQNAISYYRDDTYTAMIVYEDN